MIHARTTAIAFAFFLIFLTTADAFAASPVGRWRGSWTSQSTGHRGPLKAHIRQIDNDSYRAIFVGRFFVVVPFAYPTRLDRVPGTSDRYVSTQRLPLIGTYQMNASVTPHHFHAYFQSGNDRGMFQMSR